MALVHSIWTKPILKQERGENIKKQIESMVWCYASSVAYAKRNNAEIHLYADGLGYDLLSFLPYDGFFRLKVPDFIPTELWAAGKFYALSKMNLGDIHIDGDVFIKSQDLITEIETGLSANDLIVQSIESSWEVINTYYKRCRDVIKHNNIKFINGLTAEYSPAYNCGVVGFNNDDFKYIYLQSYLDSIKKIYSNPDAMHMIRKDGEIWMDLLCEQQHLYNLADIYGFSVYNLLGEGEEIYDKAAEIGYQHLLGSEKWESLNKIKEQLLYLNPEIYNETVKKLENYI